MATDKVLADIERTIKKVSQDIKKKNGAVGCDKLDAYSKLINSYARLLELTKEKTTDPLEEGVPDFIGKEEVKGLALHRRRHVAKKNGD